jgi:hypothetical protein
MTYNRSASTVQEKLLGGLRIGPAAGKKLIKGAEVPQATGKKTIMVRIGLTFDEYVALRLRPPAGADRAFHAGGGFLFSPARLLLCSPALF